MKQKHDIAEILQLAAQQGDRRVCRVEVDNKFYWVKRCGINDRPWRKKLHKAINYLPLPMWARLAPYATGKEAVSRETNKIDAFRAAGFPTPHYIYADDTQIVFTPFEALLSAELRALQKVKAFANADALLCKAAKALGAVHATGLCHGRPNIKDVLIENGEIGFFDFEEAPETIMPLQVAQARDCWLLFLFLSDVASSTQAAKQAFAAYLEAAPSDIKMPLHKIVRFWHPIARIGQLFSAIDTGSEMRRIIKSDAVLFGFDPSVQAQSGDSN